MTDNAATVPEPPIRRLFVKLRPWQNPNPLAGLASLFSSREQREEPPKCLLKVSRRAGFVPPLDETLDDEVVYNAADDLLYTVRTDSDTGIRLLLRYRPEPV